jgi:hypothetical protein
MDLYTPIKVGYGDKKTQKKALKQSGYYRDKQLSNDNQQVYYNPEKKKLLVNVAGTHNLSDVGTDVYLGLGKLKDTNRYKEADNTIKSAKKKYGVDGATLTGHSLGAGIISLAGSKNDQVYSLDKGTTLFQPTRSNETSYRTSGDLVSVANIGSTRTKTLSNPNPITNTGIVGLDLVRNVLNSHNVDNIKGSGIKIAS